MELWTRRFVGQFGHAAEDEQRDPADGHAEALGDHRMCEFVKDDRGE
jgi:hypothetical protein